MLFFPGFHLFNLPSFSVLIVRVLFCMQLANQSAWIEATLLSALGAIEVAAASNSAFTHLLVMSSKLLERAGFLHAQARPQIALAPPPPAPTSAAGVKAMTTGNAAAQTLTKTMANTKTGTAGATASRPSTSAPPNGQTNAPVSSELQWGPPPPAALLSADLLSDVLLHLYNSHARVMLDARDRLLALPVHVPANLDRQTPAWPGLSDQPAEVQSDSLPHSVWTPRAPVMKHLAQATSVSMDQTTRPADGLRMSKQTKERVAVLTYVLFELDFLLSFCFFKVWY
jgi:hypothetical protein